MNEKLILVDADGVLLFWQQAFDEWAIRKGYIKADGHDSTYHINEQFGIDRKKAWALVHEFNNSAAMGWLPSLRDAVPNVQKLHFGHGYKFHVITSISDDVYAQRLRTMNLHDLYGHHVFDKITCLPTGAEKNGALAPYQNSGLYWIEDKWENAVLGAELGLKSILINHDYNLHYGDHPGVTRVDTWADVYNIIVG